MTKYRYRNRIGAAALTLAGCTEGLGGGMALKAASGWGGGLLLVAFARLVWYSIFRRFR